MAHEPNITRNMPHPGKKPAAKKPGKKASSTGLPPYSYKTPLAPLPAKVIRQQAAKTMKAVYKPAFAQLGREQKRTMSISNKRKADNMYYLNWLTAQQGQLTAHQDAANAALIAAGTAAQNEVDKGYSDLRDQLVKTGESTPGVVSNPGDANAFDVSSQAQRDSELVAAERQRSTDQLKTGESSGQLAQANNFAMIAAAEANRQADQWSALSKFGDARQQLRLSKAADQAKEVSRMFDREIEKAKVRGANKANAVNAAITAQKFGLDKQKFGLDVKEFESDRNLANKKFGLDKQKAQETKRYHEATTGLAKAKTREAKEKESHKITTIIQEGIGFVAHHKNLSKLLAKNPEAVVQRLTTVLGSSVAANAAVQLMTHGSLNSTTKQDLKQIGYIIPPKWR